MSIIAPARRVNLLPAGIVAGIIGGILIDAFLVIANGTTPVVFWQYVASGFIGKAAYSAGSYAILGAVVHFAVSAIWGGIYALVAQSGRPSLVNRPILSGVVFGLIVWATMLLARAAVHSYQPPVGKALVVALIAHCIFFGLPIALYVSNAARKALA